MTHSIGPWTAKARMESYSSDWLIRDATGRLIATVKADQLDPAALSHGGARAVAALVVAAPDLLACLRDMEASRAAGYDLPWGTVRAAIVRAEGKT